MFKPPTHVPVYCERCLKEVPQTDAQILDNAQIIFQVKGETDFNEWNKRISLAQRETSQPVVRVETDDLAPPLQSRLINPHLITA